MVYSRKRRVYRKRSSFRRRAPIRRRRIFRRKRFARKVAMYKRSLNTVSILCTDTVNAGVKEFMFSDMTAYNDFTALYDTYKINLIVAKIRWQYNGPTGEQPPTIATQCAPTFHWMTDKDDANVVTSVASMGQYDTHKSCSMKGQTVTVKIRPYFAQPIWQSAVLTAYAPRKGWIGTAYPSVPHLCFKWILDASLNGGGGTYNLGHLWIDYTYYFSCKSVK